ncbi:MAG: DMT family transporter, partial [Desulfobacteraceae bacterium]|nr:DMT family transporter [Desulfobacteraceae bacterium]
PWLVKRNKWQIRRQHLIPLSIVALIGYIFPYAAQPFLIKLIGHGFIGMLVALVPIFTILVSIPLLRIYPSRKQFFGTLIGMVCLILMVIDGLDRNVNLFYLFMALLVPFCYAVSNALVQRSLQDLPPVILVALFMTAGTIALTPLSLIFETITVDDNFVSAIVAIVLLSVFARGIAMLFFYKMIKVNGPLFASMVTYVIPIEALMWSWLDNERITFMQVSTILIVLLVVCVVQRDIVHRNKKD